MPWAPRLQKLKIKKSEYLMFLFGRLAHLAAATANVAALEALVQHGAALDACDSNGCTPFEVLIRDDNLRQCIRLLFVPPTADESTT